MPSIMLSAERESIGVAIGKIASGCFVLTTRHRNVSHGLLVSWVQQASFQPPMITVCIKQGRPAVDLVRGSGRFVLNVIGSDPAPLFKHFAKGFAAEEDSFAGISVEDSEFGPVITSCVAHLGCTLRQWIEAGDHDIAVAEVITGAVRTADRPYSHVRKNGFSY